MTTDCLAKLYDRLTPRERLPLIVAASARGDERERARLLASAPTNLFRLPDYFALADTLRLLALFHVARMLDLAALYWHASVMAAQADEFRGRAGKAERESRLDAARMLAYLLTVNAAGWRQFCSELRIDADVLLRCMPGYETLARAEEVAGIVAFTSAEAAVWLRRANGDQAEPLTSEAVAAQLREFLDSRVECWE
jgi:hypothetical protein